MASHILSAHHWGQMEGVERQDTSELLLEPVLTLSKQTLKQITYHSYVAN